MRIHYFLAFLTHSLLVSAATIHSGFNYGSRTKDGAVKHKADYVRQFNLAQNLPGAPVKFNSARLFTTLQEDKQEAVPSEAISAAIETNTTLLLGLWFDGKEDIITRELTALDAAFKEHGEKLGNLVVGLSVGNEDIYRTPALAGAVKNQIQIVRDHIANSAYADQFKGKAIGHVDTVQNTLLEGVDFISVNAYPWWSPTMEPVDKAKDSFFGTLEDTEQKARGTEIWITETGWPASGDPRGNAIANVESMEKYWKDVGCGIFGKYSTWWFELESSTSHDEYDWGIIDPATQKPRFDLKCPDAEPEPENPKPPASTAQTTTLLTLPSASKPQSSAPPTAPPSQSPTPTSSQPNPANTTPAATSTQVILVTQRECVTVYDSGDGKPPTALTTNTVTNTECAPPPPVQLDYTTVTLPAPA